MATTVAEARGEIYAEMHCMRGHQFRLKDAHRDKHGTWCQECGNAAHDGAKPCDYCKKVQAEERDAT
jgi:hypothetical protein